MEGVNRNTRQRCYEARDKEEMLKKAKYLHEEGYSEVKKYGKKCSLIN